MSYVTIGSELFVLVLLIKLQKETDKAKAERRKEKKAKKEKKEKKREEKEKRKKDEKFKLQKNQSQDSHKLSKEAGFTEAQINGPKPNTEVLEKSDLTQELGQPIKPCYSSDSTQNSNKRRRDEDNDDGLLPDDSNSHGNLFKIRLLKKHKGSDSSNSGEGSRSKTVPLVPSSNLDRTVLVSSNRNNGVPATSGRDNSAVHGIPLTHTKSNARFDRATERNLNGPHFVREQSASGSSAKPASGSSAKPILPSASRKTDVEVLKSSRQQQPQQQQIASFARPVVPQSRLKHEMPSSSVASRNIGVQLQELNSRRQPQDQTTLKAAVPGPVLNKPSPITTGKRPINEVTVPGNSGRQQQDLTTLKAAIPGSVLNKPSPITTGKRPINEVTVPGNSGPSKPEKRKEHSKKPAPTKAEKKLMKKKAKYDKLIGSWAPPVFQALLPAVVDEDEDWLSRRTKPANSSISTGEVVESCRELATASLWQPRALFLAEADIHALPYTVPF
ncbi:hypothetical protein M8C21_009642 [Ambrosia artemisiifolia]|uniref:Uncharacterized protein n=1 Tax=Ambrosia artemisiifolia TaxID=4212 RepID=A0AAD5DCQ6_AMBAR|nr:hypothetical protein M8C21_009642 [Ambrosia artemisiifolia]